MRSRFRQRYGGGSSQVPEGFGQLRAARPSQTLSLTSKSATSQPAIYRQI